MKKFKKIISTLIYGILIATEVLVLSISIISKLESKTPTFFGYSTYVIASPSMSGELEVGDVIICKDIKDYSDISVGDVITYQGLEGSYKDKKITHKVMNIDIVDDKYVFTTKGVANDSIDPLVSEDQVISKVIYKTVVITFLYNILSTIYGFIALIVVPIVYIIGNEIVSIIKEIKEDKKNETSIKKISK